MGPLARVRDVEERAGHGGEGSEHADDEGVLLWMLARLPWLS